MKRIYFKHETLYGQKTVTVINEFSHDSDSYPHNRWIGAGENIGRQLRNTRQ